MTSHQQRGEKDTVSSLTGWGGDGGGGGGAATTDELAKPLAHDACIN